jgi:voltage-gated potassium channel
MNAETDALRSARKRLVRFTWILAGTLVVGAVGYAITLDVSVWRALSLTVETLAYLGKQQKEGNALYVQLFLLHVGTLVTWYAGWLFVDLVMEHHFVRHFREMRRMKQVESMSGHAIVCGGGRVGAHLAEALRARGEKYVVVEVDADATEALRAQGHPVLTGDARDEETLRAAGAERARRLFAVLPEAEKNVMIALTALPLNASLEVHARCERVDYAPKLTRAGVHHVVVPQIACADQMLGTAYAPAPSKMSPAA